MIRNRKKRKGNRAFFLTILILLLMIFFSHRNPEARTLPSAVLNTALSPVNRLFYSVSDSLQGLYDRTFGPKATQAEIDRLTLENAALSEELRQARLTIGEAPFLENEFQVLQTADDKLIPANVAMQDPSHTFVRFQLDKGTKDGVAVGDIVLEGVKDQSQQTVQGLVGIVSEVGVNYALVTSILDQSSNLSILFPSSGKYGIINNRDAEQFYGYLLDAQTEVAVEEEVVTSGVGGKYPRGLYIGAVRVVSLAEDGLTKNVSITPAVDFSTLYRVLVLPMGRTEASNE